MADLYANFGALAQSTVHVLGRDYDINIKELPNTTALFKAIHGGGIEAGTSEIVKEAAKDLGSYYEFDAKMSSGNGDLHITSTNYDEPRLLDLMARHSHVISVHGYGDTVAKKTLLGGKDAAVRAIVKEKLTKAGFVVEDADSSGGIAGLEPNNVVNKTTRSMGIQLELSTALRKSFFTNDDYSRTNRLAGNYTTDFWRYVNALREIMMETTAKYPFSHVKYNGREHVETLKLDHQAKIDVLSQYVSSIDRYPKLSGELDDSNRIERAINDLSVNYGGGKLLLGKETYIISKPLNFKSNIEIEGFGDATVIQASINSNTFAFINLVNISSSKLRNVKLDGKASARTLTSATGGIFITGSNNCLVENVTLTDFGFNPRGGNGGNFITVSAIEGQNSCYGNIVRNCRLIDSDGRSSFGIRLWTSWEENKEANQFTSLVRDNIIENNYISGFDWNSIELAGVATIENKIMGNSCENLYGYGFVEADKGSSYNVFAFNKCKKPMNTLPLFAFRDQGIPASTSPVYPARTCVGNQWIGNEAKGIVQNDSTTSGGFLAIRSRDCSVTNLKITDISTTTASNHNIAAIVINSDVENLMVTGGSAFNVKTGIYNNGGNNITISNFSINAIGYGYYSTAAVSKDITISNNTFKGGTTAINMSSEENILIIGNTIRDCSSVGIRFNNAKGSAIGNGISNTTNYGIDSRQADQSVQNNRLTGCIVYTVENVRNSVVGNFSDQDNSRARVRSYGSTMPSGGSWMKGDYVENTNITLQGTSPNKYVVKGWLRATTGNTHVLNTDWFEDRALTGT